MQSKNGQLPGKDPEAALPAENSSRAFHRLLIRGPAETE